MMVMVCHHCMLDVEMVDSYEMTGSGYSFEMLVFSDGSQNC